MDGQWLTYAEAAERLGISPGAVKRRAMRHNWARQPGNDGRARVLVPEDVSPPAHPQRAGAVVPDSAPVLSALNDHIATLKADNEQLQAQLAAADARADQLVADLSSLAARMAEILAAQMAPPEPEPLVRPWWQQLWRRRA
jgi:hypothetical protein